MGKNGSLRTLLIGIDAACPSVLKPQFKQDRLPHLQQLLAGASGTLKSQIPPWTASAWPSLYTGTNPGKHGVFDFLSFDGYEWDVINATHVRRRTLWEYLDYHGLRSVVLNVPVTHPPRQFDGALIPGYTAPESPSCHPSGLLSDVKQAIGGYQVYGDPDTASECIRMRGDAFQYLTERFDPDFGFIEFQWTDTICHERPGDWAALERIYSAVDDQIGTLLDACEPQNVLVVSDHGIGPYQGRSFLVNEFLRDQGFVQTTNGGAGMPTWADVRDARLKQGLSPTQSGSGLIERMTASVAKIGLTSQRLGSILSSLGLDEVVLRHVPTKAISTATEQVDFPRSKAYMRSRTELGIRINLEGREPAGIVPESEYESVRSALIECLEQVETPAGEPVFESVVRRGEYFKGPEANRAVDVITIPAGFDQFLSTRIGTGQFAAPDEPWNHKRSGFIAARGAAIDETASLDNAHLFDVTPTVLATFGIPADAEMDGQTLPVVESAGTRTYPLFEPDARQTTNAQTVEQRLEDLGYLE